MSRFELPDGLRPVAKRARRLEWVTLLYLLSVVILMYLVMGNSQAMKAAWLEDLLSLLPAIAFLVASRIYDKPSSSKYPYGYHRVFSVAFLSSAVALFAMGGFLMIDSSMQLIRREHPTIGSIELLGRQIWMGWPMIAVLLYSAIPAVIVGRKKVPLAKRLHNKVLHTDAEAQKADYLTAFAAIAGIVGIGFGLWWADAAAALFISGSVLKDGYTNLRDAVEDLMDRSPVEIDRSEPSGLPAEIEALVRSWPWVRDANVRLREHGQVFFGEIRVVPNSESGLVERILAGEGAVRAFDWRILDVAIMPVKALNRD